MKKPLNQQNVLVTKSKPSVSSHSLRTCLGSAGYTADARDVARLARHSGPSDHFEQSNLGALFVACDEHQLGPDLFKDALNSITTI